MRGLVAYDDDSHSESEGKPTTSSSRTNDKSLKSSIKGASDASKLIIRRPPANKNQTRAHISEDITSDDQSQRAGPSIERADSTQGDELPGPLMGLDEPPDELPTIRALLKPPSIPGVENWGIPPEPSEPCDPDLYAKLRKFSELKRDPVNPKHFNNTLMTNRSFRNPHLYAKLVEFIDVDERATNFPKDVWDPNDVRFDWYADQLADAQKERSEKQATANSAGKRSRIDFVRPKDKETSLPPPAKKSRFQPPNTGFPPVPRDRPKSRWG